MTEGIWIALIGVVQAVSLGLLGKVTKDSSRSRKQVENSHGTNFRDDVDGIKTAVDDVWAVSRKVNSR